jgi:hypothetical protein
MRMGEVFILGTITGAVVLWLWGREIRAYAADSTRAVRAKAADGMRAVEEKTGSVMDRSGAPLRRAEEFLQGTKERVGRALRAGQRAIRPAAATGKA